MFIPCLMPVIVLCIVRGLKSHCVVAPILHPHLLSHVSRSVSRPSFTSSPTFALANLPYRRSLNPPTVWRTDSISVSSSCRNCSISISSAPAAPSSSGMIESSVCFAPLAPEKSPNNCKRVSIVLDELNGQ